MKLEPNMYVRTNKGEITKIVADSPYLVNIDKFKKDGITLRTLRKIDILNASHNIIDLIEVGDYVNGVRVDEIIYIGHGTIKDLEISFRYKYAFEKDDVYTLKEQDIKSIVTKEQFSQMEYKVVE